MIFNDEANSTYTGPRVTMVDSNDNVIGYKYFREINFATEIYRVSRLWVTDKAGNILLQKRSPNVVFNRNKWACAVGGTNDEGETYESNIIKEAQEEIGLAIAINECTPVATRIEQDPTRNIFCKYFIHTIDAVMPTITFDEYELGGVKWFSSNELKKAIEIEPDNFAPEVAFMLNYYLK